MVEEGEVAVKADTPEERVEGNMRIPQNQERLLLIISFR